MLSSALCFLGLLSIYSYLSLFGPSSSVSLSTNSVRLATHVRGMAYKVVDMWHARIQGSCLFVSLANVLSYKVVVSLCPLKKLVSLCKILCPLFAKPCVPGKTLCSLQNLVSLCKTLCSLQNLVSLCKTLCSLQNLVPLQNFVSLANIRFLRLLFLFDILLSLSLLFFLLLILALLLASVLSLLASFLLLGLQGEKDQLQVPCSGTDKYLHLYFQSPVRPWNSVHQPRSYLPLDRH